MTLEDLLEIAKIKRKKYIESINFLGVVKKKEKEIDSLLKNFYSQKINILDEFKIPFPFFKHSCSGGTIILEKSGLNHPKYTLERYSHISTSVNEKNADIIFKVSSYFFDYTKNDYTNEKFEKTLPFYSKDEEILEEIENLLKQSIKKCLDL